MTQHKKRLHAAFLTWLPFAIIIIIFTGLAYVAVQQNYRMNANDPQIQITQDITNALNQGTAPPDSIVPPNPTTDIGQSLQPFVAIYTATGTPIGSSVAVNGKLPTLPSGVFDYVKSHGEERFTWQPSGSVRVAAVVTRFTGQQGGFVLAGRSLKEIEIRESQLTMMAAFAGILALVLTYLVLLYLTKLPEVHHTIAEEPEHHLHHAS